MVVTKVVEKIFFSDISKTKSGLQIAIESGLGDFSDQKIISGDPKILGPKWSTKKSSKIFTSKPPKMVNPTVKFYPFAQFSDRNTFFFHHLVMVMFAY